jgi:hypothetical protein
VQACSPQVAELKAQAAQLDQRRADLGLPQHTGMAIALEISATKDQ